MSVFGWLDDNIVDPIGNFFTGKRPGLEPGDTIPNFDPSETRPPSGNTPPPGASPYESYAARSLSMPNIGMSQPGQQGAPSMSSAAAGLSAPSSMFKPNALTSISGGDQPPPGAGSRPLTGLEKAGLVANIASAGAGIYGQYKEGKARDENIRHQREEEERLLRERAMAAKKLSPVLAALLGQKQPTQMES